MIEAMKQALEAFAFMPNEIIKQKGVQEAITSLRQAIAESEKQEPVQVTIKDFVKAVEGKEDMVGRPVYWAQWPNADTHPQPKREQDGDCQQCGGKGCVACDAREQEPVAWYIREKDSATTDGCWAEENLDICEPLYTHPPKREPLTDFMIEMSKVLDNYNERNIFIDGWLSAEAAHGIKGEA